MWVIRAGGSSRLRRSFSRLRRYARARDPRTRIKPPSYAGYWNIAFHFHRDRPRPRGSKLKFEPATCSEQTANQNTNIAWQYCKVVRKQTTPQFHYNARGFFIGPRASHKLFPFLFQLRGQEAIEKRENLVDQFELRRRFLRYNVGLGGGRLQTTLFRGAHSCLLPASKKPEITPGWRARVWRAFSKSYVFVTD